jgi:hypothetical protein
LRSRSSPSGRRRVPVADDDFQLDLAASGTGGYIIATVPVTADYTARARIAVGVYQQVREPDTAWRAWLWPAAGATFQPSPECESTARPTEDALLGALRERAPWWTVPAGLTAGSEFPACGADVNWELLKELYDKPHPLIRDIDTTGLHYGLVELLHEAKAVHHLLDLAGVPRGYSLDTRDIDSRTLIAVRAMSNRAERLSRISAWHSRETGPAGTVGDYCVECGHLWPCETRRTADGTYKDEGEDDE